MRVRTLLGITLSLMLLVATPSVVASAAQPTELAAGGKGPIGWDVYRKLDGLAGMRPDSQTRQFSSFDRTGQNNDGFNNTYSCLRHSDAGCVIAERSGAGEIESMWFTRDNGSMVNNGRILVELDGKPVLDALLQEVVDGRLGAPYEWPLVGNGDDTAGGSVIKVPMPYRESMRITIQSDPFFYHVTYREFADAAGVTTFDPADKAEDVIGNLRGFGISDPKPAVPGATPTTNTADVAPGAAATFAEVTGSGWLTQVRMRLPQVIASPRVGSDGRAFGAGGGTSFRMAVDENNSAVRLTRRIDPQIGNQAAKILVEGQEVAVLNSGPPQPAGSWVDQVVDVPPELTAGKSSIEVRADFVSADLDINEFRYDVHSKVGDTWSRTDVLDVGPGHDGEERSHAYNIRNQNWEGYRVYRYPADPAELEKSDAVLADAHLKITFDGQSTVDAPIGEFFGSGLGEYDSRTLFAGIDATSDGWYSSWWPMPYAQGAKVEVVNGSGVPITGAVVEVTSAQDPAAAEGLGSGALGYFNATYKRAQTTPDVSWNFVEAQGSGVFYGATHSMRGLIPAGNRRNYLEGDETVYVDGGRSPALYGTGSEDFYESGWYFREGTTYSMPLAGNPAYELDGDGCQYDCTGAYRLMVGDAVSFSSDLSFNIEHGPLDNELGDYSSTAYWYGQPTAVLTETDTLDASDDASRTAHGYTAEGETRGSLESTFEGRGDTTPVNHGITAATGPVSFTLTLAEGNDGARLLRLGDQQAGYQRAAVFVDDLQVGEWLQPLGNGASRWLEDSFELPASATAGKSTVTVRIEPVAGGPAWSAATYRALSRS